LGIRKRINRLFYKEILGHQWIKMQFCLKLTLIVPLDTLFAES
jgi:hypothetical protein